MIKIGNSGEKISLQSILPMTEGQRNVINKKNASKINEAERDFHISHLVAVDENGNISSKAGRLIDSDADLEEAIEHLKADHQFFLEFLDSLVTAYDCRVTSANEKDQRTKNTTTEEVMEKIQELKDELAEDGFGICVYICGPEGQPDGYCGWLPMPSLAAHFINLLRHEKSE